MSPRELVLASGNAGKLTEFGALLSGLGARLRPQSDFGVDGCEETGLTFVENAILKARHAARHAARPALADDSGIEVDALDGAPGIYSARYAGAGATDAANVAKLLDALRGVAPERRGARFRCVIAFLRHADDPSPLIAEGALEGRIAAAPAGAGGFGYDPVMMLPGRGCTVAELSAAEKNRVSHRARALAALQQMLARQFA